MATEFLKVTNRASSTLDGNIADDALSLDVAAGEGVLFPDEFPFHITIEDEILSCTNRATDTLTVVRAQQGTVAVAHSTGVDVQLRITAKSVSDLNDAVNVLEEHPVKVILKTADETVNNSDAPQNDDELLLAVGVNEIWEVTVLVRVTSSDIADFRYTFTVPAAGAFMGYDNLQSITSPVQTGYAYNAIDLTGTIDKACTGALSDEWYRIKGIYVGGGTAGNLQFQWCQRVAEVSDTKVLANSYLMARKLG